MCYPKYGPPGILKIDKNEPTRISSLSEFIEWVNQLDSERYLFRGVPNAKYKIQASAYRRQKKEDGRSFEKFLQINRDLITDTRLRGHGEKDGRKLGDLEILAQLQHFGAATCLIDFTRNAQVALYFACQRDHKWEKNTQDSGNPPDGKVYAVRSDPLKVKKVTPDLLNKKIDHFFPITPKKVTLGLRSGEIDHFFPHYERNHQLYFWEPGYQNNRIIAQQSVFVFGAYEFDENNACIVEESCKKDILIELERVSGINEAMLFPDFDGFARLYREEIPYTELSVWDYFMRANQVDGEEAILNYDRAIELDPKDSKLYFWRGSMKEKLKQYEDAIDDFNKMVEIDGSAYSHEVRGRVLFELKRYREAIDDFSRMIELIPDDPFGYCQRGEAKYELGQYQEAIDDFNTALQIAPDFYAYFFRGMAKKELGDIEGAEEDIQKAGHYVNRDK